MRSLHVAVQGLLGHELDVGIQRQHEILTRKRLALFAAKHMPARIERCQHMARRTVQIFIEVLLKAAKPVVIQSDIPEDLRSHLVVGIKALEFLLDVNAPQVERLDLIDEFRVLLASHPCKVPRSIEAREYLLRGSK